MPSPQKPTIRASGKPTKPDFGRDKVASQFWDNTVDSYDGLYGKEHTALLTMASHIWSQYIAAFNDFRDSPADQERWKYEARWIKFVFRMEKMVAMLGLCPGTKIGAAEDDEDEGVETRPADLDESPRKRK